MSLATVCASSANACVAVFSLPPVAIIAAPVASLWAAALVAAAAVQCRVGGNRLPFRRRAPDTLGRRGCALPTTLPTRRARDASTGADRRQAPTSGGSSTCRRL